MSRMDFSPLAGNTPHVRHELLVRVLLSPFRIENVARPKDGELPNYRDGIIPGHFSEKDINLLVKDLIDYRNESRHNRFRVWRSTQWRRFKIDFKRQVERIWNVLWARPVDGNEDLWMQYLIATTPKAKNLIVIPPLKLALNLKIVDLPSEADLKILCLNTTRFFRSWSFFSWEAGGNIAMLDRNDVHMERPADRYGSRRFLAAAHEIGHYLGFHHVAANIPGNPHPAPKGTKTNNDAEYGTTGRQRRNVMGDGARVEPWNAAPWLNHIHRHFSGPEKPHFEAYVQNRH